MRADASPDEQPDPQPDTTGVALLYPGPLSQAESAQPGPDPTATPEPTRTESSAPPLAVTGSEVAGPVSLAIALVTFGAAGLVFQRRRETV